MNTQHIVLIFFAMALVLPACGKNKAQNGDLVVPLEQEPASESAADDDPTAAANAVYKELLEKCKNKDGAGLWAMTAPEFQASGNQYAASLVDMGQEILKEVYRYDGPPDQFDGKAYMVGALQMDDVADNPCSHWADWRILEQSKNANTYTFSIGRPDGRGFALRLSNTEDGWIVKEFTRAIAIPEHLLPDDWKKPAEPAPKGEPTEKSPEPEKKLEKPLKPPKSFGVKVCDDYAKLACSCSDTIQREFVCKDVHRKFPEYKKIAQHRNMRSFVEQGCKDGLSSISEVCR